VFQNPCWVNLLGSCQCNSNQFWRGTHKTRLWHGTVILNTQGLQSPRQPDHTPFTLEINGRVICSQTGGHSAERTAPGRFHTHVHPTAFHTNVQWDPRTKLFLNTWLAAARCLSRVKVTSMQVFVVSSLHVFELDSTWKFPFEISLLEVCLSQVISRAVIGHLSVCAKGSRFCYRKGEINVVCLVEWL
jgi:hypothetical protein